MDFHIWNSIRHKRATGSWSVININPTWERFQFPSRVHKRCQQEQCWSGFDDSTKIHSIRTIFQPVGISGRKSTTKVISKLNCQIEKLEGRQRLEEPKYLEYHELSPDEIQKIREARSTVEEFLKKEDFV